jgi:hypothetical protein
MLKKFTQHPQEQNETYLQHMCSAWRMVFVLKKIELKLAIHSVVPFLYTDALSSQMECLQKMTSRGKQETEDDLYEVYGGD